MKWFTDDRAAAKIVETGSIRYDLQCFGLRIFQICLAYKISLDIQWVPRNEVAKADFISLFIDVDDWQISRSLFHELISTALANGDTGLGINLPRERNA